MTRPSPRGWEVSRRAVSRVRLLRRAEADRLLLLAFNELHRADADSLELLRFVCRDTAAAPILVIGALRPELDLATRGPESAAMPPPLHVTRRLKIGSFPHAKARGRP